MKNKFLIIIILMLGFSTIFCSAKSKAQKGSCISGDCENGKGTMILSYARKVFLVDENNVMHEEIRNNDAKYEGDWKNGKMHGKGVLTYPNSKYTGDFKDGEIDGNGTWEMQPESAWGSYTGEWKKGHKHGKGRFSSYAESYDGEWKDDMKNGYGTYTWNDMEYSGEYSGEWKDDMKNGKGTEINYKDGKCIDKYIGVWNNNKKMDKG